MVTEDLALQDTQEQAEEVLEDQQIMLPTLDQVVVV